MNSIVICGGGTAGHVMPSIALIPELKKYFGRIAYIGSIGGMEEKICKNAGIEFHGVECGKLRRKLTVKNFTLPFKVIKGIGEAKKLLKEIRPHVVFSKGGYVAVPVVVAASMLKIPVVAHESDLSPGLANRFTAKMTSCVCTSFEPCAKKFKNKGVYTGTPIRESLLRGKRENTMQKYSLDENKPVLLFMGGSSGAAFLNNLVRNCLDTLLKNFNVIHITGKGNTADIAKPNYVQIEFTENIADIFAAADFVVCRAGSNSIFEFLYLKKPMLLVPLPKEESRGDQIENAEYFTRKKWAHMILQKDLNEKNLIEEINELVLDKNNLIEAAKKVSQTQGNANVMKEIIKYSAKESSAVRGKTVKT